MKWVLIFIENFNDDSIKNSRGHYDKDENKRNYDQGQKSQILPYKEKCEKYKYADKRRYGDTYICK